MSIAMQKDEKLNNNTEDQDFIFADINYICGSTSLIIDSLQKGLDIAQLPSGDIIVTEVKTINTQYAWNPEKNKMVKIAQH